LVRLEAVAKVVKFRDIVTRMVDTKTVEKPELGGPWTRFLRKRGKRDFVFMCEGTNKWAKRGPGPSELGRFARGLNSGRGVSDKKFPVGEVKINYEANTTERKKIKKAMWGKSQQRPLMVQAKKRR